MKENKSHPWQKSGPGAQDKKPESGHKHNGSQGGCAGCPPSTSGNKHTRDEKYDKPLKNTK